MNTRSNRFSPTNRAARYCHLWSLVAITVALSVSVLAIVRFWRFSSPYPPGLDGAQWLSYGRMLFGGAGRGAESTYAPSVPVLAHGADLWFGPVVGTRVLAVAVLILLTSAVWLICVDLLGVTWGSVTTALVVPCTAMTEPFFYGGYPQQAALAFGLFGIAALMRASRARRLRDQHRALAIAAIGFALSSFSHLLFGPILLASGALIAVGFTVWQSNQRRFLFHAMTSLVPGTAVSLLVARAFLAHGYHAPLAVSQRTLPEAWTYASRESPALWATIVFGGMLCSSLVVMRNNVISRAPLEARTVPGAVVVGVALILPATVLIIASGQPRLAPPILFGGAMLLAFTASTVAACVRATALALSGWIVVVLWLAGATTGFAREFASYYQVLDASLIAATRSIPATIPGSIAVPADRRGWPVGWWVEALQQRPVFTGSNPQWLAFPNEQARAAAITALLASPDTLELRQRADDLGVTYLLMRKWDWIGWERWLDDTAEAPVIIYDDNETIVLEIAPVTP